VGEAGATAVVRPATAVAGLVQAIEAEIIPRLMLVRRARLDGSAGVTPGGPRPGADDVDTLAGLVLAGRRARPSAASKPCCCGAFP
jgi:hypothetical protein